ncbi:hypothetical protein MPSEU_000582000 [Mayamaea pseudoterrestris]|nr:hypothetical protein MPSEU_000582000 [Mayamaea pseudoterrestris]
MSSSIMASLSRSSSVLDAAAASSYHARLSQASKHTNTPLPPLVGLAKHLLQPNGSIIGTHVAQAVLPQVRNLLEALPKASTSSNSSSGPLPAALASIDGRLPLDIEQIRTCMEQTGLALQKLGIRRGHRVALCLENGPTLALAILCLTTWCSCVPLNAFGAVAELESDLVLASVDLVIGQQGCSSGKSNGIQQVAEKLGIAYCGLQEDAKHAGLFVLQQPQQQQSIAKYPSVVPSSPRRILGMMGDSNNGPAQNASTPHATLTNEADRSAGRNAEEESAIKASFGNDPAVQYQQRAYNYNENNDEHASSSMQPNGHNDEILVLFTSGTTGSKKLVPHLLADVLVATSCIAISWQLASDDINLNLMPLFHVGGIIRQVFSPILSGGCVICCPSFDPAVFWSLLKEERFTWYYAAPTMHQIILQTGQAEGLIDSKGCGRIPSGTHPKLRMIANAAGGLLPSLARELRQAFQANVLPSYGMTECMPITSPPATYQLEKPGTSGVAVGPEVAIYDVDGMKAMSPGKEGAICVRGAPCFRGYGLMAGEQQQQQTFLPGGWFNTGDIGYQDSDGYLYITGRSKEVINRGGEIISPLEVEEAVNEHPLVQNCIAFSTPHSILQEVVGIVLIPVPNMPMIDLTTLHAFLGEGRLTAPKWPQCVVYMSTLPKSHTNKVLRVKLAQRLRLPELNDTMYPIERTFQAECPPQGTPVSVAIPCQRISVQCSRVQDILREALVDGPQKDLIVVPHPNKIGAIVCHVYNIERLLVVRVAKERLDAFAVPSHVCTLRQPDQELPPPQSCDAVGSIEQEEKLFGVGPTDPLVSSLQELMQELLDLDCLPAPTTNFFNVGGSSMLASQLASKVRKIHNVSFGGSEVFHHTNCIAIAKIVRERKEGKSVDGSDRADASDGYTASMAVSTIFSEKFRPHGKPFDHTRLENSSGLFASLFQLIPLLVVYPVWQLTRFFLFFRSLVFVLYKVPSVHSLILFVATLITYHFLWITITPLVFVALKWTIIGKYQAGRYPIWGQSYLRWWFVDVMRKLIGRGIFGSTESLLCFYYKLCGATIGQNARISLESDIAEYDLVTIGEGAAVEYSTIRGFGVDNGCMMLGPVAVGDFASVGVKSVVCPYTAVPDFHHLGPATSSYEVNASLIEPGHDVKHSKYNRQALPEPTWISQTFICRPIMFMVDTISHLPALYVLYWMVSMPWRQGKAFDSINDLMAWLCDPRRIPFYIGIRVARAIAAPFMYMLAAVLVKRLVIGKFQPGPRDTCSQWQLVRHKLAQDLFTRERMQDYTELVGRHYELVSCLYRALGAKVGKRVFWPGHQPIFSGEFDLLEIGDDVVFGSRSTILATTTDSAEKIVFCAGANVSDNTVVLPGSIIGKNAVLGSNTLCPAGRYLPEASVSFGAKSGEPVMLERGAEDYDGPVLAADVKVEMLQMTGDDSTLRPFGKAFYQREANYFVWPLPLIISFTLVTKSIIAALDCFSMLGALHLSAFYWYGAIQGRVYQRDYVTFSEVYTVMLIAFCFTHCIRVAMWLLVEIGAKWAFMGTRKEGRYNYHEDPYAQNWECYQIVSKVRQSGKVNFLDFIAGTPYLATLFRMMGGKLGDDCCLYPAGADPFPPEIDMVVMGDRCVVDCSSVVCHLNTRGNFELVPIKLENNVTLRTGSRVQQGVTVESGAMLLEKSLAMTGEVIEADTIWQGAPASRVYSYDTSSIASRESRATETGSYVDIV